MTNTQNFGVTLLRIALAFVFLWFGFSQISDAAMWTSFVPTWATAITSAGNLVYLNGVFEIIAGSLLAIGILPRYVSGLLGLHLIVISSSLGFTAIGVRDFGLGFATLALAFLGNDRFAWSYRAEALRELIQPMSQTSSMPPQASIRSIGVPIRRV